MVNETQINTTTVTDYLNGFQYKNSVLQYFPTTEGYVNFVLDPVLADKGKYSYVYNYTDHLGNIRLSYALNPVGNALTIVEENHYYPFGLKHANYNSGKQIFEIELAQLKLKPAPPYFRNGNNYKYNGKELQEELGLNVSAMDFRQYDMAIGRFVGMDRLSEFTHSITPYRFALNNPNYFNDPSGLSELENNIESTTNISSNGYASGLSEFENNIEGLTRCPTCPDTPEFKPLIDDPNTEYFYNPETNQASELLDEVVVIGKPKAISGTDYNDISMLFRTYSGYALTAQKPLGVAYQGGSRYASQLYSSHTSNVVYKTLGGRIQVPLGNYNTATIGKLSKALKITGKTLGIAAVGIGVYDIGINGLNVSNGLDTTMAILAISPTGIGQGIATAYFITNFVLGVTFDTNLGEIIENQIDGE